MKKPLCTMLTGALCLAALPLAHASDDSFTPDTTHFVIDLGGHRGGDNLVTTTLIPSGETKSLDAGDGVFGDFGIQHNLADSDWAWKLTYGLDTTKTSGNTGDIRFRSNPVDLLALYSVGDNHFGVGATQHMNTRLDFEGPGVHSDFNNATGAIVQYQWWIFGARYTNINYKVSGTCVGKCSYDGSNLGVFMNIVF